VTVPDFEVAYIDQRIKLKVVEPIDKKAAVSKEVDVRTVVRSRDLGFEFLFNS
jgi:hypothetical protein